MWKKLALTGEIEERTMKKDQIG